MGAVFSLFSGGSINKMPIREYKCHNCGKTLERLELNNRNYGKMICDNCDKVMERVVVNSNFVLNGKWFKDGY